MSELSVWDRVGGLRGARHLRSLRTVARASCLHQILPARAKLGAAAFVRHAGAHAFTVNLLRNARVDELRGARLRARLRFREYSKQ